MRLTKEKKEELLSIVRSRYINLNTNSKPFDLLRSKLAQLITKDYQTNIGMTIEEAVAKYRLIVKAAESYNTVVEKFVCKESIRPIVDRTVQFKNIAAFAEFPDEMQIQIVRSLYLDPNEASGESSSWWGYERTRFGLGFDVLPYAHHDHEIPGTNTREIRKILKEMYKLGKDMDDFLEESRHAIFSCTTVKKLIEVWPEIEELIPKDWGVSTSKQLAVPVDELNKSLGLPSKSS